MCSTPTIPPPVTPAPAPAPAAPAANPATIGQGRIQNNISTGGTVDGPSTRVDRNVQNPGNSGVGGVGGGTGLNI